MGRTKKVDEAEQEQEEQTPATPAADLTPPTAPMSYEEKRQWTRRNFDAEPKVSVMIPLAHREKEGASEVVVVNGYSYIIQKGMRVEVPKTVADILDERLGIMSTLGKTQGVDGQDVRLEAALERAHQTE